MNNPINCQNCQNCQQPVTPRKAGRGRKKKFCSYKCGKDFSNKKLNKEAHEHKLREAEKYDSLCETHYTSEMIESECKLPFRSFARYKKLLKLIPVESTTVGKNGYNGKTYFYSEEQLTQVRDYIDDNAD